MLRRRILTTAFVLLGSAMLSSCDLFDSVSAALNVFGVSFSEDTPAVDGYKVTYSGGVIPHLSDFALGMTFHVKADNTQNANRAAFGSDAVKPVLNFYINSKSNPPISTSVDAFSVEGGQVGHLNFPLSIPFSLISTDLAKKIVNCDSIPYYLSGTVTFNLMSGSTVAGSGTANIDLTSGKLSTCPSGSMFSALASLVKAL